MANGRGPLASAAARIPAPPSGSVLGDLSTAATAFAAGLMQRRKEKREEARKNALLELEKRAADRADEQLRVSQGQLELAQQRFEREKIDKAFEAARLAEEQAALEAARPATVTVVEDLGRRLGLKLDRTSLQNMPIEQLNILSDDLRQQLLGQLQLQAQQRSNELLERQQILQELQRVENAISQVRQLRQNIASQLQAPGQSVGLWQKAGQLSRAENISIPDAFQRVFNERLEEEMLRQGGPGANLRALMEQAAAMRAELGRLRGVGGVPATSDISTFPAWAMLSAPERAQAEQEFKQRIATVNAEAFEEARMAGWPVDAWIFELQQGAGMDLGGMSFEQMVQQRLNPLPFPQGSRSPFSIQGVPTLPLQNASPPPAPQGPSPFTLPNFNLGLGAPDPVLSRFEQQAGLRRHPGPQNPPLPPVR